MTEKTLTFPLFGGNTWSATFTNVAAGSGFTLGDDPRQWRAKSFDLDQVTPEALAHGLSLVNRFCGATVSAYSVAEHSLLLVDWVERLNPERDEDDLLACLIHDAPEAMGVADAHGALKKLIAQPTRDFEAVLTEALWGHLYGRGGPSWNNVFAPLHVYDQQLGDWEAAAFGFPCDLTWFVRADRLGCSPGIPRRLSATEAERLWLEKWESCL